MALSPASPVIATTDVIVTGGPSESAVSWAAIFAGAVAAVALSLILFVLGSGLGLAMVSPWSGEGATTTGVAISSIVFLIVIQWVSSGVGGYMAGRLRTKWTTASGDEVFFRDTAHGFLAWALATLLVAGLMSSAITSAIGGATKAATEVTAGAVQGAAQGGVQAAANDAARRPGSASDYFVDRLFRPTTMTPATSMPAAPTVVENKAEATAVLARAAVTGQMPAADKAYLAQMVASRTGMSEAEATRRVDEVLAEIEAAKTKARQAADEARKAAVKVSLLVFLALLIGAFIGSAAGAYGGQLRDEI